MIDVDSLSEPELVALVVLLKAMVLADARVSQEEAVKLSGVAARVGIAVQQHANVRLRG